MDQPSWKKSVPQQSLPDYINEFVIQLDPPQPVYYPGQMLNGYVVLDLKKPKELISISIKFIGSVKCYWKEEIEQDSTPSCNSSDKSDSSRGSYDEESRERIKKNVIINLAHEDKNDFIYDYRCLYHTGYSENSRLCVANSELQDKNRLPRRHATGRTFYEFAFQLPAEGIPSSFEGILGYIRYSLEGIIKTGKKGSFSTIYMLTINEVVDTNDLQYEVDSQQSGRVIIGEEFIQQSDSEGCLWMVPDSFKMTTSINRSCYCPGEAIFVNLDVLNESDSVQFLRVSLLQKVVYRAPTTYATKAIQSNLFVLESPPIHIGETYEWVNKPLAVPATVPTIVNCKLITVMYYLKFSVPMREDKDIAVSYFITIGTVPFIPAYEKSVFYGTADDWPITNPPKPNYILGSTYAPVQTSLLGHPDLKPPSYSAPALTPAKAQYWLENNTNYTPVYTYAEPYVSQTPQNPLQEPFVPTIHSVDAINEFSIVLQSKQLVYYPGEIINGVVVLDLKWRLEIKRITLRIIGRAFTSWKHTQINRKKYEEMYNLSKGPKLLWKDVVKDIKDERDGAEVPECNGREILLDLETVLFDSNFTDSEHAYTHPSGRFEYTFFIHLTPGLQSSYEGRHGNIRYFLQANLELPGQEHVTRYPLIINSLIDTNAQKYESGKGSFKKNITDYRKVGRFKFSIDAICLDAAIDRTCYCPGEGIIFNLHIHNKSKLDVEQFYVRLLQKVAYTKDDHRIVLSTEIGKIVGPSIKSMERLTWIDRAIGIPAVVPTITTYSIRVSYILEIIVEANKDVKPEVKFNVIIGTVPHIEYYGEDIFYGTEDEPEGPPECNEIKEFSSPPPNPTVFGHPYMHPPCYSAAVKDIPIPLKHGFNLNEIKPYIPIYTFAKPYESEFDFPGIGERDEYFKFGASDYVK